MNDETFDIKCPHCGSVLECDATLFGEQVDCPCCNKKFIVRMPQNKPTGNNAHINSSEKKSERKKAYLWGRAYIALARILAMVEIVVAIGLIAYLLYQPFSNRNSALKKLKDNRVPELVKIQNEFQENYIKAAELVTAGDNPGFQFFGNSVMPSVFFNEKLMSEKDVENSLKTLCDYEAKIAAMSEAMRDFFERHYQEIFRKFSRFSPLKIPFNGSSKGNPAASPLKLNFGRRADFYTDKKQKVGIDIRLSRDLLLYLARCQNNQLKYQHEIDNIKKGIDFIEKRLNSKPKKLLVGSAVREEIPKKDVTTGRDQFEDEKEKLQWLIESLNRLSSHKHREFYSWMIAVAADNLKCELNKHLEDIKGIKRQFFESLKLALYYSLIVLFAGILAAFLLMVIADFLEAHFDSAVFLKSIDSKVKNFLLLPLLLLLFLTGCGEAPDVVLKKNIEHLKSVAIDAVFADKISENPGATIYLIPGRELILISGGIKKIFGNRPITAAACYNVSHVVSKTEIQLSPVEKYDQSPYTHRAQLQMRINYTVKSSDTEKNPDGTPGLAFHFFPPEQFDLPNFNKKQWIDQKLDELPESQLNHMVALYNIANNKAVFYSEHRKFTVYYNSKKGVWDLERASKPIAYPLPPVYSDTKVEEAMQGYNFKKLITKIGGIKKIFWFKDNDYDDADKILNQGLLKIDGVWKRKAVVIGTVNLNDAIVKWEGKNKVSLSDLTILLKAIKENPEAENRGKAVELAETAILQVFLNISKDMTIQDRDWLKAVLKYIQTSPYITVVNRERVETACKDKIALVEKKINERFKKAKEKVDKLYNAIKEFESDCDVKKLANTLEQHSIDLGYKPYVDAYQRWKAVADIATNKVIAVNSLFSSNGRCGEYMLLSRCSRCNGSGLQNCKMCKNTGRCSRCHGRGRVFVTNRFTSRTDTLSCPRSCQQCQGRTKRCFQCRSGRRVNAHVVKEALKIEFDKVRQVIVQMHDVLNK